MPLTPYSSSSDKLMILNSHLASERYNSMQVFDTRPGNYCDRSISEIVADLN